MTLNEFCANNDHMTAFKKAMERKHKNTNQNVFDWAELYDTWVANAAK